MAITREFTPAEQEILLRQGYTPKQIDAANKQARLNQAEAEAHWAATGAGARRQVAQTASTASSFAAKAIGSFGRGLFTGKKPRICQMPKGYDISRMEKPPIKQYNQDLDKLKMPGLRGQNIMGRKNKII